MPAPVPQTTRETTRETAPIPRLFGAQSVRVTALFRIVPDLAVRLSLGPARTIHVTAAFLESEAAAGAALERSAEAIANCDPRTLLDRLMPNHHPRLFKALDRAALPAWSIQQISDLDAVLWSGIADDVLGSKTLSHDAVASAHGLLRAHPIIRRVRPLVTDQWTRDKMSAVLLWLQEQKALRHLAMLPEGAGRQAIARRLRDDLAALRAAPCPLALPDGWEHLSTPGALWQTGIALQNCVTIGSYGSAARLLGLLAGTDLYLLQREAELLVHLRHAGGRLWALVEAAGKGNRQVNEQVENGLIAYLTRGGAVILPIGLEGSLDTLLSGLRRSKANPDDDDHDLDEEIGELLDLPLIATE